MSQPLLQLTDVKKSFGAVRALKGVSFDIFPGEVHALVGENGAGKSTLIKIITGAHWPDAGSLRLDGREVTRLTPAVAQAFGIAPIYQQPALMPDLSVAENMALILEKKGAWKVVNWRRRNQRAKALLERVGANIHPETEVRDLSMPEQQLVEIARALGAGARLLIMDEPTASLTAREVELLLALVKELRSQGVAIIYITHRLEEVFQIADRVTVLRDGESAFSRGVKPATQSLQGQDTPLTKTQLVSMMVGREISMIFPPSESSPGAPVLQLKDFGCSQTGIHGVNLEMRAGEILGLAGLVGSGRTELARILFGITPADTGSMLLDGKPVRVDSPPAAINFGIAYVPEDRRRHGVFLQLPIAHNISASVLSRLFPGGWIRREKERDLADKYVRELSIKTPSAMTGAGNLSGGNQQKVALARWLATSPRLLILDEPTQGVDVGAKAEIHKLIRQFAAEGLCVLMISSELPEIIGMSDRIAVMRHGTVVQTFPGNSEPGKIITAALGEVTSE